MPKPPTRFTVTAAVALLWNLAGLFAVVADLRLSPSDIAALPPQQQALHAARPLWSVAASVVAVVGGSLGCVALLLRKRWSIPLLGLSLVGVVLQDIGIFIVAGPAGPGNPVAFVLQGLVLAIAVGLVLLARQGRARSWLS